MVPLPLSTLEPSRLEPIEDWPWLGGPVLVAARSRKVCMTCHWFRHHAAPGGIPMLTCQLHQGLLAHGDHLTHRCSGWTDDLHRQRGWGISPCQC
ncbi:galactose oxidase [Cyanobium sp. ATX 6F1]|uniref:galactose oxidase n=1 Tax=unclassified Cyanobium TaxID=2627006 RepID=UPI0020CFCB81|nr:galactose oxidase [Cyanobium sp. ATX 6F1]MCP9916267.1 galactose oxidase [Cyanobium sp. ATX 6F1]